MAENEEGVQIDESRIIEEGGEPFDVIIVGAGAAGVGVAIALGQAGIENLLLVDRDTVGSSFASWPEETRFITPSFPSNSIGMLDLNSIAIGVSPAFSMRVEHPTGQEYASHLQDLAGLSVYLFTQMAHCLEALEIGYNSLQHLLGWRQM